MIRILTLTSLFPNKVQPVHGIFVRQRLQHLAATHAVQIRVVAPVPWYPPYLPGPASYKLYRHVPDEETFGRIQVSHPRFVVLPKVGMNFAPGLMAISILRRLRHIVATEPGFDLIDAHYFYPDGVAAAWIAGRLGLPLVITARGTDINLIAQSPVPRRQILWAASRASAIITVCDALRCELMGMGIAAEKISTLRNGYEPSLFHPVDRLQARAELRISGNTLLSVGHLIERKGHHIAIDALAGLKEFNLVIVGTGEMEQTLRDRVRRSGLQDRVRFDGAVEQSRLKLYYSACDALVLASSREGMANVLIEAIACGCPAVAMDCWGTPEVVSTREAGVLVRARTAQAFENGIRGLFARLPDRADTAKYARQFLWGPTSRGQFRIFAGIAGQPAMVPAG